MRTKTVWAYLALALVAAGTHWLLPDPGSRAAAWDLLGTLAVALAAVGITRNRPDDRRPWIFLAIGLALFVAGDIVWDLSSQVFGEPQSFIPQSDVVYLSAYPFFAVGLLRIAQHRRGGRAALLDGGVVAIALSAPLWTFVIRPVLDHAPRSSLDRVITIAYPLMDVVLLVIVAYTVFTLPRWNPAAMLLIGGLMVNMAADILYARFTIIGTEESTPWLDPLWPASYALLAAAFLHPAMRELTQSTAEGRQEHDRGRIGILILALFAFPTTFIIEAITGERVGSEFLSITSIVISSLVVWRLVSLVRDSARAHDRLSASEQRSRALVQNASDAVAVTGTEGELLYVSPGAERLLGRSAGALLGTRLIDLVHPDDVDDVARVGHDVVAHPGEPRTLEGRARRADGTWRWMEVTSTNHLDVPAIGGIVANFRDVTVRHRTEAIAAAGTRALEMIARAAPLRPTLEGLLQAVEGQIDGARCAIRLVDPESGEPQRTIITSSDDRMVSLPARWAVPIIVSENPRRLGVFTMHTADERSPSPADVELVEHFAALAAVAVDRTAAEDRLHHQAFHDPLTGLPNRALLIDRLGQALLRLQRNRGTVAVMFLDLDRFKVINDSLGHDAGDELLLEVGHRLRDALQTADTVARFGGDEFVMICERVESALDARAVAERAARALSEPIMLSGGGLVVVTASIGIAFASGSNDRAEALLRDADAAMYRAKEHGGAGIEVFDAALRSHVVVRLETERSLRRAIEQDELRVRYQPVIALSSGAVTGFEALVRWQHPTRGVIGPGEFIQVAEETGLIVPIGEWMLGQASDLLQHFAQTPEHQRLVVSVNLSGRQLSRSDLVSVIERELHRGAIDPSRLCLEVTESVLLDDIDVSASALRSLKALGLRLAVDDFGTGYSSLGYLKQFPFDLLKIDQAFVAGLGASEADDAIVRATVEMAHALEMEVVAEGVETELQRDRAHELGCDFAQGYLFAAPQGVETIIEREASPRLRAVT